MNIAEWISAVAALGALLAAVWAAKTSVNLFKIESARDNTAAERAAMDQASGIAAWCVYSDDRERSHQKGIQVHNSSDAPVYDVVIESTHSMTAKDAAQSMPPIKLSILPPGDYVVFEHPKYLWAFAEERDSLSCAIRPVSKNPQWIVTGQSFTDARGVRWVREGGALRRMESAGASI